MKVTAYIVTENGLSAQLEKTVSCLEELSDFTLVSVSESSDDGTLEWCRSSDKIDKVVTDDVEWPEGEADVRKRAMETVVEENPDGDWLVCLDDDEIIPEPEKTRKKLRKCPDRIDRVRAAMYNLWEEDYYRIDAIWGPLEIDQHIAQNLNSDFYGEWGDRGPHCGNFPQKRIDPDLAEAIPVIHFGWRTSEEERERRKQERIQNDYKLKPGGEEYPEEHKKRVMNFYESITWEPELKRLPERWRHLV